MSYLGGNKIDIGQIVTAETERLSKEFGKSFLDCEDIVKLTGLGRDNVRGLMNSSALPVIKIGKRKVVGIVPFVLWEMNSGRGTYAE